MAMSKTLLLILTISNAYINIYGTRNCHDCVKFHTCPDATTALDMYGRSAKLGNIIRRAKCGNSHRRNLLVCCSDFAALIDPILSHVNVGSLADSCQEIERRLIGGPRAVLYELPWMALLSYNDPLTGPKFGCGGTILNSRYILTAAHCVKNQPLFGVRVGEHDIRTKLDCQGDPPYQDLLIADVKIHEEYVSSPHAVKNDIALLRLNGSISFSHKNVARVCLPLSKNLRKPLTDGQFGTVAGWGITEANQSSSVLLKGEVPLLTNVTCTRYERRDISNQTVGLEFCAGARGKDSCRGDSGGPFFIKRYHNGRVSFFQYGIMSRGPRECGTFVGIYTNVMEYLEWILNNIKP